MKSPCRPCGACCCLRVTFPEREVDAHGGVVPIGLTEPSGLKGHVRMRQVDGRCVALDGVVGQHTGCTIYDQRPSPCRDFQPSTDDDNPYCDLARSDAKLPPLPGRRPIRA